MLAAVVLHVLVHEARDGIDLPRLARACERDPEDPAQADEVRAAAESLLADGLATRERESFEPTRAALRAAELSF